MESWIARRRALEGSKRWVNRAGRRSRWRKLPFKILMALFKRSIRLTPFYGWGRRNALDIKLIEFDLAFPDLPAPLDGYRILHVSDPHLDRLPELVDAARALLVGLKVDMLALTGDIRGDDRAPVERSAGLLKEALAGVSVRGPRLAVLGNHDPVEMVGALERVGFDVLINRSLIVRHEGDSLRVRTTSIASILSRRALRWTLMPANSASPWFIRPRLPTTPMREGTRFISVAIHMAARSAYRAAGPSSPTSSDASTPRAVCGARAT